MIARVDCSCEVAPARFPSSELPVSPRYSISSILISSSFSHSRLAKAAIPSSPSSHSNLMFTRPILTFNLAKILSINPANIVFSTSSTSCSPTASSPGFTGAPPKAPGRKKSDCADAAEGERCREARSSASSSGESSCSMKS